MFLLECGLNTTSKVDSGEFSSIALVVNRDSTLRCTASIISPLWALTSASCVNHPDQEWILIAGNSEFNMSKISKNSVISLIGNIVTYPEVSESDPSKLLNHLTNWSIFQNDFALLELKQVLSFANQIYSACLDEKQSAIAKECLTTGWLTQESSKFMARRWFQCVLCLLCPPLDNAYERYEKITTIDRNCTSQNDAICVTPQNKHSAECYVSSRPAIKCWRRLTKIFLPTERQGCCTLLLRRSAQQMAAEWPSDQAERLQRCSQARNLHQPHRKDHRMDQEHSRKQPNVHLSVESSKRESSPSTSPSRKNILCQFCKNFCKIKWNRNQISSRKQKFLLSTISSELCIFKWNYLKLDCSL